MQDILGRKLQDGDICVGKGTGRNVIGMSIGVWYGNSMTDEYGCKRHMRDLFKVVNPSDDELEIANKIKKKLQEQEEEKEKKKRIKTIPLKDLVVGGIYKCVNNCYYIYLGKRKVIVEYDNYNRENTIKEGHCFNVVWDVEAKEESIKIHITDSNYNMDSTIEVLKGNKKLTELVRTIELNFPMSETYVNCFDESTYKIIVE